jgi:anti-sigma regulatory factor (Ser/Thr protein kinase)
MCEFQEPSQTRLPSDAQAPGLARAFLRGANCEVHHAPVLDEAELLVSELVTNAVLHGAPPITMRVECDVGRGLRVSVTDGNPQPAHVRRTDSAEESGRGIRLVDVISDAWGVEPRRGDGKDVWFRLLS